MVYMVAPLMHDVIRKYTTVQVSRQITHTQDSEGVRDLSLYKNANTTTSHIHTPYKELELLRKS